MSHFVIGVIVDNVSDVEYMLEPYSEHLEVEPYVDRSRSELLEEFNSIVEEIDNGSNKYMIEQDKEKNIRGMSLKEFSEWYYGSELDDEGNLLSTYNPYSKWDWWVEGGRWSGMLKLKDGTRADYAKIKDIDFSPDEEEYKNTERFWELAVEGKPLREGEEKPFVLYRKEYFEELYGSKERYAEEQSKFNVFGLVYEGDWYEKGQMGWFGVSDATRESTEEFRNTISEIIEEADPEQYLVIVDCHI